MNRRRHLSILRRSQIPDTRTPPSKSRRGAILTMELILVLPIFLILLFAIIEFSLLSSARTRVTDAARYGVRRLCVANEDPDDIRREIRSLLGPKLGRNVDVEVLAAKHPGELANVFVSVPMKNATPDLLWVTGFSVSERFLVADAPMVMEHDSASIGLQRL